MAKVVVESSPPLSSKTALGEDGVDMERGVLFQILGIKLELDSKVMHGRQYLIKEVLIWERQSDLLWSDQQKCYFRLAETDDTRIYTIMSKRYISGSRMAHICPESCDVIIELEIELENFCDDESKIGKECPHRAFGNI